MDKTKTSVDLDFRRYIYYIATISLVIFCKGLTDWKYGVVGDEFPYYDYAVGISRQNLLFNPFYLYGVYGIERTLGSYWQAIFLWIIGENIVAWRLANVLLIFPAIVFFSHVLKILFNKRVALIGAILLGTSYFLINFFKIGYTHPSCFLFFIISLYACVKAIFLGRKVDFALFGCALGISFYLYAGPIFPLLFFPLLLLIRRKSLYQDISKYGIFFLCYLALLALGFITTPSVYWMGGASKTILYKEFSDNFQILVNIGRNFLLFFTDFDYFHNHYVKGAYLDTISQLFAALGIGYSFWNIRNKSFFILLWLWIATCVVLGGINPYWYTPSTRGMFFIPFGVCFAAIGISTIASRINLPKALLILLITVIGYLNLNRAWIGVFLETGYDERTQILKYLRDSITEGNNITLFISEEINFDTIAMKSLMRIYNLDSCSLKYVRKKEEVCTESTTKQILILKHDPKLSDIRNIECISNGTSKLIEIESFVPAT